MFSSMFSSSIQQVQQLAVDSSSLRSVFPPVTKLLNREVNACTEHERNPQANEKDQAAGDVVLDQVLPDVLDVIEAQGVARIERMGRHHECKKRHPREAETCLGTDHSS